MNAIWNSIFISLVFFNPLSLSHFVTHPGTPPESTSHISDLSRFLEGLVQKTRTKAPCTNSFSLVRGSFCPGGFVRGSFVWKVLPRMVFVRSPLLEYICYNRKLKITLNFMFHMYDKKIISMTSHALDPLPPVTNCHTFSDPLPSSATYFMDGPFSPWHEINN